MRCSGVVGVVTKARVAGVLNAFLGSVNIVLGGCARQSYVVTLAPTGRADVFNSWVPTGSNELEDGFHGMIDEFKS